MIDISAVNANTCGSKCIMKVTGFLTKKGENFLIFEKELSGISSGLSMQKNCAIQPQSNKKSTTATENQASRLKKPDAIFVKEAKIENAAAPAIKTFASYLHGLQTLKGC